MLDFRQGLGPFNGIDYTWSRLSIGLWRRPESVHGKPNFRHITAGLTQRIFVRHDSIYLLLALAVLGWASLDLASADL